MNHMRVRGIFLISAMILVACQSDKPVVDASSIDGEWEVVSATRDGRVTKTVDGAIFNFDMSSSSMVTDILGSEASSPFELKDGAIVQEIPEITYQVIGASDTTIQLSMSLRGSDFTFLLNPSDTTAQ